MQRVDEKINEKKLEAERLALNEQGFRSLNMRPASFQNWRNATVYFTESLAIQADHQIYSGRALAYQGIHEYDKAEEDLVRAFELATDEKARNLIRENQIKLRIEHIKCIAGNVVSALQLPMKINYYKKFMELTNTDLIKPEMIENCIDAVHNAFRTLFVTDVKDVFYEIDNLSRKQQVKLMLSLFDKRILSYMLRPKDLKKLQSLYMHATSRERRYPWLLHQATRSGAFQLLPPELIKYIWLLTEHELPNHQVEYYFDTEWNKATYHNTRKNGNKVTAFFENTFHQIQKGLEENRKNTIKRLSNERDQINAYKDQAKAYKNRT